jgi:cell cycle checkpoint control protein RAD9A
MAVLTFTINPDALGKLHDALVCLGKFSEAVCLEASSDRVSRAVAALIVFVAEYS